jgi:hypothetical protein
MSSSAHRGSYPDLIVSIPADGVAIVGWSYNYYTADIDGPKPKWTPVGGAVVPKFKGFARDGVGSGYLLGSGDYQLDVDGDTGGVFSCVWVVVCCSLGAVRG